MAKKARFESHVRLYSHEIRSAAYQSLSTEARALLIEMRALYSGKENRVFMSTREIMRRLGVGQWRAEKSRDELLDRGFIHRIEKGEFKRKVRHATVYRLTNEPTNPGTDGSTPTKDYMSWHPEKKSTVLVTSTVGTSDPYREPRQKGKKGADGTSDPYREPQSGPNHGTSDPYTDRLPTPTPIKPRPGWESPGHTWRCRNSLLLNTQCAICRVWITEDRLEFDGRHHNCDQVSKTSHAKTLDRVPGGVKKSVA